MTLATSLCRFTLLRRKPHRLNVAPLVALTLCLLVFYGPMILLAGTVVVGVSEDAVGHMLWSLGDDRPGGRFFHYFDLSANARLWGNDVKYSPLHVVRLISIALGANHLSWAVVIVTVHSLLFLSVYYYARKILHVSTTAAITGAAVAFFATSWLEWTALVYWTAGTVLLVVSICEYWIFVTSARRGHLLLCTLANTLQPYVTQSQALMPTQAYLLGTVLLMAFHRRGAWRSTVSPLIRYVWPLTALGWIPILAPVIFAICSGLTTREAPQPLTWGVHGSVLTHFLGLLFPAPPLVSAILGKLGWSHYAMPPNNWLFGSFLFVPSLVGLWHLGRRPTRIMVIGVVLYGVSLLVADLIAIPSTLVHSAGFSRLFAFPALSGLIVAAAVDLQVPVGSTPKETRVLHRLYWLLLGGTVVVLVALLGLTEDTLTDFAGRFDLVGAGTAIPGLLRSTTIYAAGIACGLAGYLSLTAGRGWGLGVWGRSALASFALCVTVAAPAIGIGYGIGWYERPPELEAMISPPSELRFLREHIPSYVYRVGVVLASELQLAQGDWEGYRRSSSQRSEYLLSQIRKNDLRMRQGLAFVLPWLHFYAPVHHELRREGNPFVQRPESPGAPALNERNVIVRPEAKLFEDYGVRYWLSNTDLQRLHPQQFERVFQGEYASVFENRHARPVAYLLEEPTVPLSLDHTPYGIAIRLPTQQGGRLSAHLDLRRMNARAVDVNGRAIPLTLEPSGLRWEVDVPPGSSTVVFTANESATFAFLASGAGAVFLLLITLLWKAG